MKRMKLLATSFLALSLGPVGVVLATHPDALEVQTQNGIDYVADGIGKEQADESGRQGLRPYAHLCHRRWQVSGGYRCANEDMNGNTLLNTVSEGPLFLANLPVGRYKITASARGTSHTRVVHIGGERLTKVVFQWSGYATD